MAVNRNHVSRPVCSGLAAILNGELLPARQIIRQQLAMDNHGE